MIRDLEFLELGLSDFCQNRCVMCHQSRDWFAPHPRGFLDPEIARALAGELAGGAVRVHALYLFWIGEPLLHPDFPAILDALFPAERPAVARGFVLNTNGQFLRGAALHATLRAAARAEFAHAILSLDSTDPETYARIRRGGDHAEVMAALRELLARRTPGRPIVVPQMVVMPENAHEIDRFIADIRELGAAHGTEFAVIGARGRLRGDSIYLRPLLFEEGWLHDPAAAARHAHALAAWRSAVSRHDPGSDPEQTVRRESADPRAFPPGVCRAPFTGAVVTCAGKVVPCCGDYFAELELGDLREASLAEILAGDRARALRRAHLAGDPGGLPQRCRRCHLPAEGRMAADEARARFAGED